MRFRKVKIVRGEETVEYNQDVTNWKRHYIRTPYDEEYWKKPRKKLKLENTHWFVLDAETGEKITRCDSIGQAKRFCIKNSYDFGMYG